MFCVSLNSAAASSLNYTWFHEWKKSLLSSPHPSVPSLNLSPLLVLISSLPSALYLSSSAGNSWLATRCHVGVEPGENRVELFKSSHQRASLCLTHQNENKYRCVDSFWIIFWISIIPFQLLKLCDSGSQPFLYHEYSLLTHTMDTSKGCPLPSLWEYKGVITVFSSTNLFLQTRADIPHCFQPDCSVDHFFSYDMSQIQADFNITNCHLGVGFWKKNWSYLNKKLHLLFFVLAFSFFAVHVKNTSCFSECSINPSQIFPG